MKALILGQIIAWALCYLLGAFVAWNIDPSTWPVIGRLIMGGVSTFLGVTVATVIDEQ